MVKKNRFGISKRLLYTLITIGILVILGIGVYAMTAGTAPNPGHLLLTDIAPPASCSANQFLQWVGSDWACSP
jgi:hypothetical protein